MHISEGILPFHWAALWFAAAVPFVAYGLWRLKVLSRTDISVVITAAALLIQALFLAHGGLSTWGANILSMGVAGSFAGYGAFRLLRKLHGGLFLAGFAAGLLADWATYAMTSAELASGIRGDAPFMPLFTKILIAFVPTQLPLGILEGAMTAGMVTLLYRKRPDLLVKMRVLRPEEVTA
ncbi:MAG: energy-coupling factor ABC transporter permease [Nitrospirota bacterium]